MSDSSNGSSWLEKLSRFFSSEPESREELETILEEALEQDLIDQDGLMMILGVLNVSEKRVRDVMIPKMQMAYIDEADDLEAILHLMYESAHSRYPVFSAENNEVIGILLAKDVLRSVSKHELTDISQLQELYRPPVMVSESKRLNVLLKEFKKSRNHMALVVDEYGELAGLVTIEDVLEEIVGDIEDEYDDDEANNIQRHVQGGYQVDALTPIEEFNAFFGCHLEDEQLETIGGYITKLLGHIPQENETFVMSGLSCKVLKADVRRIESLLVDNGEAQAAENNAEIPAEMTMSS